MNQDIPPSPLKMTPGAVLVIEVEKKSASKLHIPDTAKKKREWGMNEYIVIATGGDRILDDGSIKPMPVKLGDRIMPIFSQGIAWEYYGKTYIAMPMEAVIGIEDGTVMAALESEAFRDHLTSKGAIVG